MIQNEEDVNCPFRAFLPPGKSSFIVPVPRSYCNKKFYFSDLSLVPDYYSQQAASYGQDLKEELDSAVDGYSLYLTLGLNADKIFTFKYDQDQKASTPKTINEFIKDVNGYFETNKPPGMTRSPLFFDWIDTELGEGGADTIMDVVKATGNLYYNQDFDEAVHGDQLPPSVADLPNVNTTLFPSDVQLENVRDRIRLRMHLAPAMKATFSTDAQLKAMGFTETEYGPRIGRNQLVVENRDNKYKIMEASVPPFMIYKWGTALTKLTLAPISETWVSPVVNIVGLKKRDEKKNAKLAVEIEKAVKQCSAWSNWDLSASYNANSTTFHFKFPNNTNVRATLNVSAALGQRTGYGLVRQIDSRSTPEARPDQKDITDNEKMSRALAFDTGVVIVSLDHRSSNTTAGINSQFMAFLHPTASGTLDSNYCSVPTTMDIPRHMTGSGSEIPVNFLLSRFNEANSLTGLVWKTGAYVYGVLRGTNSRV
jgi:hypothetical protein